jgi:hypothetical protein
MTRQCATRRAKLNCRLYWMCICFLACVNHEGAVPLPGRSLLFSAKGLKDLVRGRVMVMVRITGSQNHCACLRLGGLCGPVLGTCRCTSFRVGTFPGLQHFGAKAVSTELAWTGIFGFVACHLAGNPDPWRKGNKLALTPGCFDGPCTPA